MMVREVYRITLCFINTSVSVCGYVWKYRNSVRITAGKFVRTRNWWECDFTIHKTRHTVDM